MAGLMSRASLVLKAKLSKVLDRAEDPGETLDYSYEKQLELLQNVKRGIADVVTAKKRLELQRTQLRAEHRQARRPRRGRRSPQAAKISHEQALERKSGAAAAAPGTRRAGAAARGAAGEADREREDAVREGRGVPLAEGSDQGPVLGRRGAGADRRSGDGDRRADGRHRARDPAGEGQDRADAGAGLGDRRADRSRARSRTSPPTRPSSTASSRQIASKSQVDEELAQMKSELGAGRASRKSSSQ